MLFEGNQSFHGSWPKVETTGSYYLWALPVSGTILHTLNSFKLTSSPWRQVLLLSCFPGGSDSKESACSTGDLGSIPGSGRPLEKGVAAHSSILAWRIPWTEEPGGLQCMGLQRVGHDWVRMHAVITHIGIKWKLLQVYLLHMPCVFHAIYSQVSRFT